MENGSVYRYTVCGIGFGLLFPVLATIVDLVSHGHAVTWGGAEQIHRSEPLHWIIDTAPFVLGFYGFLIGQREAG
jgi:two-component system aerobic respiration control sensor histidine kinase ArcB